MHRFGLAVIAAAFLTMAATHDVGAQQQPSGTYYVVTYVETQPGSGAKAATLIRNFGEAARKDAGNLRFETLRRVGWRHHFAILEAWKDKAAGEAHAAAAHTKQFRAALQPMLTAPYDERPHGALAVADPATKAGVRALFVVTHVDIIPPKKDEGLAATSGLAEPSRKEPGNMRFEVLQQSSRPNHMTVVEIWRSRKAQETHAADKQMLDYRTKLLPMSGSLYDERLYRIIRERRRR
jgi:quinol monooxygenase YgiN